MININILAIIISVLFGIISIVIAVREGKRARRAEQKLLDLEQSITSFKYVKDKAYKYYSTGNYDESLDAFKKFLSNNKDEKIWNEIIYYIFKKETEKIFSGNIIFNEGSFPSISLLIQTFITYEEKYIKLSPYPTILKTLLDDYSKVFEKSKAICEFFIALFDKDWAKAKNFLISINMLNDEDFNNSFKQFITLYLNKKLGITDDTFVDDIPF